MKKKKSKKHDLLIINRVVLLLIPFGHKINRNFHWDPLQRRKWWHILGWEGVFKSKRGGGGAEVIFDPVIKPRNKALIAKLN